MYRQVQVLAAFRGKNIIHSVSNMTNTKDQDKDHFSGGGEASGVLKPNYFEVAFASRKPPNYHKPTKYRWRRFRGSDSRGGDVGDLSGREGQEHEDSHDHHRNEEKEQRRRRQRRQN
uniref:Uncharacterized protein n=1 Tax=Vitis vinifera TaxID=29760 RepID=A5C6F9_VITVI|nr:hypothetical protein VITISV_031509 [Vitis vinifera]